MAKFNIKDTFFNIMFNPEVKDSEVAKLDTQQQETLTSKCIWRSRPICRYCKGGLTKEKAVVTVTYWYSLYDLSHKDCQRDGAREESYECQMIDENCNDCKHYSRERTGNHNTSTGTCSKFNKPTSGSVNFCQSNECFEHRRVIND